jgi:pyruvate, water dikinase
VSIRRSIRRLFGHDRWVPLAARPDAKAALHLQYLLFKDLISSNDEILEVIADMERKLEGTSTFGMAFIRSRCVTAASHAYRMIQNLNSLSDRRHSGLHGSFSEIHKAIEGILERVRPKQPGPFVLPLSALSLALVDRVGGKSANLGELRNKAGLPVPEGFAVTTDACLEFLEANQLSDEIRAQLLSIDADDLASASAVSESIRSAIQAAELPERLEATLNEGFAALEKLFGYAPRVAMRSSAVGEDGELSFAGQYVSVLNVPGDQIAATYKEIIAGLYTPRAISYRAIRGVPEEDTPMGVTCLVMVDAVASGVACTTDPSHRDKGRMVINASWGLGVATVEGSVSPDSWVIQKDKGFSIISSAVGPKETSSHALSEGGIETRPVRPEFQASFCLSEVQAKELARLILAVEQHYGAPQEVEWALGRDGRFFLLQARPLHPGPEAAAQEEAPAQVDGHSLILSGAAACAGCASGPAVLSFGPEDIQDFPQGGILVARHSDPQYVRAMDRAAAVVTDVGAPTGHMASLAREFGIPAVLDTHRATSVIPAGATITVDGDRGAVYDGRVHSLLSSQSAGRPRRMVGTPVYGILEQVSRHVVTLTMTNPKSPEFQARFCRTFHDIARFVHEKAFEEMFRLSDAVSYGEMRSLLLSARLPFTVHLIDLGGGVTTRPGTTEILLEDVASLPMKALLVGMTDPALRWWTPRALSLSGFASVTTQVLFTPLQEYGERRLGDRSYAIVADAYCNFSSRIGYHFAAVDAYCTDSSGGNYISFRFKGGAADEARRVNRCLLIEKVLRRIDFQVERQGDLINARLRKFSKANTLERLSVVGRVIIATRQLDMRIRDTAAVDWFVQAFFDGNYLFEPDFAAHPPEKEA